MWKHHAIFIGLCLVLQHPIAAQTYRVDEDFGDGGVVRKIPLIIRERIFYKLLVDTNALYVLSQSSYVRNNLDTFYTTRIDKLDIDGNVDLQFGLNRGYIVYAQTEKPKSRWDLAHYEEDLYLYGHQGDTLTISIIDKRRGMHRNYRTVEITPNKLVSIRRILYDSLGILLSGTWINPSTQRKELFVCRLNRFNYQPDWHWGYTDKGWVVYGRKNTDVRLNDIAYHGQGLVVYGFGRDPQLELGVFFRLTAEGEIDRTFGTFRNVTTVEDYGYHPWSTVHIDAAGKIYLLDPLYPTHVIGFTSKGKPDTRYGFGGVATNTDVEALGFQALGAFGAPDGRVFIVGYRVKEDAEKLVGVVLGYNSDGSINTALGRDGYLEVETDSHLAFFDGHIDDRDRIYLLGTEFDSISDLSNQKGGEALYLTRLVQKTSAVDHTAAPKTRFYLWQNVLYSDLEQSHWEEIVLIDKVGRPLYSAREVMLPLHLPSLPAGVYILRARSGAAHYTQLLFVQ